MCRAPAEEPSLELLAVEALPAGWGLRAGQPQSQLLPEGTHSGAAWAAAAQLDFGS